MDTGLGQGGCDGNGTDVEVDPLRGIEVEALVSHAAQSVERRQGVGEADHHLGARPEHKLKAGPIVEMDLRDIGFGQLRVGRHGRVNAQSLGHDGVCNGGMRVEQLGIHARQHGKVQNVGVRTLEDAGRIVDQPQISDGQQHDGPMFLDPNLNGTRKLTAGGRVLHPRVLLDTAHRAAEVGVEQVYAVLHVRQVPQLNRLGPIVANEFDGGDLECSAVRDLVHHEP